MHWEISNEKVNPKQLHVNVSSKGKDSYYAVVGPMEVSRFKG